MFLFCVLQNKLKFKCFICRVYKDQYHFQALTKLWERVIIAPICCVCTLGFACFCSAHYVTYLQIALNAYKLSYLALFCTCTCLQIFDLQTSASAFEGLNKASYKAYKAAPCGPLCKLCKLLLGECTLLVLDAPLQIFDLYKVQSSVLSKISTLKKC